MTAGARSEAVNYSSSVKRVTSHTGPGSEGDPRAKSLRRVVIGVGLLALSQILIFPPGSDVSPFSVYNGGAVVKSYGGATVQVWAILLLLAICGFGLARSQPSTGGSGFGWTLVAIATALVSGAVTSSDFAVFAEGTGKIILPLMIFSYLIATMREGDSRTIVRLVIAINVFTAGQSLVCKVLTGSFASNMYYVELPQEYFGYFYHPFAFAGILSACMVVVVNEFVNGRHRGLMASLAAVNLYLIAGTQVRTYILGTAAMFLIAVVGLTIGKKRPVLTLVIAGGLSLAALVVGQGLVANSRVTTDVSSGRLDRWVTDVHYVWSTASPVDLIIGAGPGRISDVNQQLFGIHINSLNAAVDSFVDFGVLGLLTMLISWYLLVRAQYLANRSPLVLSAAALLVISAAVTNPLEFPAVGVTMVLAIVAVSSSAGSMAPARGGKRSASHAIGGSTAHSTIPGRSGLDG